MEIVIDNNKYNLRSYNTRMQHNSVVKTPYGIMKSIKMKNYNKFSLYIYYLNKSPKWAKVSIVEERLKKCEKSKIQNIIDYYKNDSFLEMIQKNKDGLKDYFVELLKMIIVKLYDFDETYEGLLYRLIKNEKTWNKFRHYVLDFNAIYYEEKSDNNEIAEFDMLSKQSKRANGSVVSFSSKYSAIQLEMNFTNKQMDDLTLLNFNLLFNQKGKFVTNQINAQYKMFTNDIKVPHWAEVPKTKAENKGIDISRMGISIQDIKKGANKKV